MSGEILIQIAITLHSGVPKNHFMDESKLKAVVKRIPIILTPRNKKGIWIDHFFIRKREHMLCTHWKRLIETLPMSTTTYVYVEK